MKTYYVECSVKYVDDTEGNLINCNEDYSFIIQAKNKKDVKEIANEEALKEFNEDLNIGFKDISVVINDCYVTSDDARCD